MEIVDVALSDLLDAVDVLDEALPDEPDRLELLAVVAAGERVVRLLALAAGRPVGLAVGKVVGGRGQLDLIAVRPGEQGQGVGRALLRAWEDQAGVEDCVVGGSFVGYAWPGVDTRRSAALAMLVRHGYRRTGIAFHMAVDPSEVAAPSTQALSALRSSGVTIRRATAGDLATVTGWIRATFHDVWAEEISRAVRREPRSRAFVAWRAGIPVGFSAWGVDRRTLFGPLATDAAVRGTGLGGALTRLALADMAAAGVKNARIGWIAEEALPFYARTVGATLSDTFWILGKQREAAS